MGGKHSASKHRSGLCKMDRFLFRGTMQNLSDLRNRRPMTGRGSGGRSRGGEGSGGGAGGAPGGGAGGAAGSGTGGEAGAGGGAKPS